MNESTSLDHASGIKGLSFSPAATAAGKKTPTPAGKDYRSLAIFGEDVGKAIGEKQNTLEELVPLAWRELREVLIVRP